MNNNNPVDPEWEEKFWKQFSDGLKEDIKQALEAERSHQESLRDKRES